MTESSAQDRSGQDRISAPLALHEEDAITNSTRDASQSANDQDQSSKVLVLYLERPERNSAQPCAFIGGASDTAT